MKRTLLSRLLICFLLLILASFCLLNYWGFSYINKKLLTNKKEELYRDANIISSQYVSNYYSMDNTRKNLQKELKAIETFTHLRIWFVDYYGNIIVDSGNTKNAEFVNIIDYDPNFLQQSISEHTAYPSFFDEPMLSLIQPITHNYRVRGYLVLHTPLSAIERETYFYIDIINIIFLIFIIILLLIFIYLYYITIIPINKLITAAMEYSAANYEYTINKRGLYEYQQLANALSYMATELGGLEDYQKKFIANISHDFRSPLTSIKGYAEAILDGTIPYEIQDKYINIILFETERLNKLTSSLLELNNMDTRGTYLEITTFDINAIIKKTAESFEGICNERKITFNLVFTSRELYVEADMSKIQQVLYNLIDNAIKFSYSNSSIKLSSEIKGEKAFISIKDYGMGIPKESINKVWERFFKTDSSRGKDKKGTGLGLSITKEIIQAHNENISVVSTEGVGTEFVFTLTKTNMNSI